MTPRPEHVSDWRPYYELLRAAGYSDSAIAQLAGVTRAVVNKVRQGAYPHGHALTYNGGTAVLREVEQVIAEGRAPAELLATLEHYRDDTQPTPRRS